MDLKGKVLGQWWWQTMSPGANFGLSQCPQGGLDPDNGTELKTLKTKLAKEDQEGDGPTMGPDFRAAEQPSQTQFQIFPVSLRVWVVCVCVGGVGIEDGRDSCLKPHTAFSLLPSL